MSAKPAKRSEQKRLVVQSYHSYHGPKTIKTRWNFEFSSEYQLAKQIWFKF